MESYMVNDWSTKNCNIVESFFENNFPLFIQINKYAYSPYWNITYEDKYIKIKIGGDVGFSIEIFMGNTEYSLWQYDRSVNEKMNTTEGNILFQLDVLKKFLNEIGY